PRPGRPGGALLFLLPGPADGGGGARAGHLAIGRPLARLPGRAAPAARARPGRPRMSGRRLRDELHDVFDSISEPAHPALSARIRQEIAAGSAPSRRAPRLAMAMALATAAILVTGLVFVSRHQLTPPTSPAGQPSAPVTASPTPEASPAPSASPSPSA